tara:strand:+ start:495 stop:749 length:255 start_codon:yes stop_codon:yes gene_type:complete
MKEENGTDRIPVEPIVICSEPWYVVPRNCESAIGLYCSVVRVAPSSSASQAWGRFVEAYGETKKHWTKRGHVAKRLHVEWSLSK